MIAIRASSWSTLFDCAYRWYRVNIDGVTRPPHAATYLGTCLHRSTGAFDRAMIDGAPISIDDAAEVFVHQLANPDQEVDWTKREQSKAEKIGLVLHEQYCGQIAPTQGYTGCEITCAAMEVATDYGPVTLTGTADRLFKTTTGRQGVADLKSGARVVSPDGTVASKGYVLQLGVYKLLLEAHLQRRLDSSARIIGLNTKKPRWGIADVQEPERALLGTPENPGLIEWAARMAQTGLFPPNPHSLLCSAKYCVAYATCSYHG